MKIYTKQGDQGKTGLVGGQRVSKDDVRIEAYGTVDELSAVLGSARALTSSEETGQLLKHIQVALFVVGAELATGQGAAVPVDTVGEREIGELERAIDQRDAALPTLRQFILPGGTQEAATLHLARTICRRAERRVVQLARDSTINPTLVSYLNRLSDLLFVMARTANATAGVGDIPWQKDVSQ